MDPVVTDSGEKVLVESMTVGFVDIGKKGSRKILLDLSGSAGSVLDRGLAFFVGQVTLFRSTSMPASLISLASSNLQLPVESIVLYRMPA